MAGLHKCSNQCFNNHKSISCDHMPMIQAFILIVPKDKIGFKRFWKQLKATYAIIFLPC